MSFPFFIVSCGRRVSQVLLLISICTVSVLSCSPGGGPSAKKISGGMAPDFTAQDLSGNKVKLSDMAGKVVLLEFWATWCPPCLASIPGLVELQNKYRDKNMVILAFSVDEGRDLQSKLLAFSNEHKINYRILTGDKSIPEAFNVKGIPAIFLIDKSGKVVHQYIGAEDDLHSAISAEIEGLL